MFATGAGKHYHLPYLTNKNMTEEKQIKIITGEFLISCKEEEKYNILNTVLHEMSLFNHNLYMGYIQGVLACGEEFILTGYGIKDMYNTIPYTKRTYLIV